jgi:6-methylsalicylic acid synthase
VDRGLRAQGVTDISASEAFAAWDLAAGIGPGHYPILGTVPLEAGMERGPLLGELSDATPDVPAAGSSDGFADLPPEELREQVLELVGAQIADEMRLAATALDVRRPLVDQGLDSVMTIMVRRRLEKRFGQALPSALLWRQPTVAAIADHIVERLSATS